MKRESGNAQDSPKPEALQRNSLRLGEITLEKLCFFSSNSPRQAQSRLGKRSLSPSPIRLNMRREA